MKRQVTLKPTFFLVEISFKQQQYRTTAGMYINKSAINTEKTNMILSENPSRFTITY